MSGLVDIVRTQSIYGAMRGAQGAPSRGRQLRRLVGLLAMWSFLAYPISDLRGRHLGPGLTVVVLLALFGFALGWLTTMWLSLARVVPTRTVLPWFAATAAIGIPTAYAVGSAGFDALFIYLSIAAAVSLPLRATIPALLACTAGSGLLLARVPGGVSAAGAFGQLSYVFWLGAMMLFYRRSMLLVIELRRVREELARMAVTEERLRIARDLHDLLGHSLSTISLKAQLARRLAGADPVVTAEIADIETVAAHALTEVRDAVTGYRQTPLAAELDGARSVLAAAGVDLQVAVEVLGLPARIDALLGWVLREAVTNVARHSRARTCRVRLHRVRDTVRLTVSDDGPGDDQVATRDEPAFVAGNGLTGLDERVRTAGGVLDAGPVREGDAAGFRVVVTLPLTAPLSTEPGPSRSRSGTPA